MANRLVEHIFFYVLLGAVVYIMWEIITPFLGAITLAALAATVCHPIYKRMLVIAPEKHPGIAAALSVVTVVTIVLAPLSLIAFMLFSEVVVFYGAVSNGAAVSLETFFGVVERFIQTMVPGFSFDLTEYVRQSAEWIASNIGTIFAGTASTVLTFLIFLIALFYLFRDGERFTKYLVHISPLPDSEDEEILSRLARAVRSVVVGILSVALIQGTLTALGFFLFGIEQPLLWGSVAAIGALIPAVGTSIVFIPAIAFLAFSGAYGPAIGLAIWGLFAVGLVDNIIGPQLVGRGATLHPFLVLLSVLGGLALFGPIGFLLGPITLSLMMVLLDLYSLHIREEGDDPHAYGQ